MSDSNILIYLLRHDLRVSDNPVLHRLATSPDHGFSHLLPVYIFPAHQIEVSGFLKPGAASPYPEARSQVGGYWRCGPHRAKFIAQAVWSLKEDLESLGSGLCVYAGMYGDVLQNIIRHFSDRGQRVGAVWVTGEESVEEKRDEKNMSGICQRSHVEFRTWPDEKYLVDDRDLDLKSPTELPEVFTTYRKAQEPLRSRPRAVLPHPDKDSLPPFVGARGLPPQLSPFESANSCDDLEARLLSPLKEVLLYPSPYPDGALSAHPFKGGEEMAHDRLRHLIKSGAMSRYHESRNGLLGTEFSSKLSAYLAQGNLTARQIHAELVKFEDGRDAAYEGTEGSGEGENPGTKAMRFELLWRDYMRLCTKKFRHKLFRLDGFREDEGYKDKWKSANPDVAKSDQTPSAKEVGDILQRFMGGCTGMGFVDASQREVYHTGYTSNRARQNVASFLAKQLGIDWRYGAEWYEMYLIDYDVSSNWCNWQYVAGVGSDPKGDARIFNPVKQAFSYDKDGEYVRTWVPEVRALEKLENVFQAWTTPQEDLERLGLEDLRMVFDPVMKIDFCVDRKPKSSKRTFVRRRGRGGQGGTSDGAASGVSNGAPAGAPSGAPTGPSQPTSSYPTRGRGAGNAGLNPPSRGGRGGYRGGGFSSWRGPRGNPRGNGAGRGSWNRGGSLPFYGRGFYVSQSTYHDVAHTLPAPYWGMLDRRVES